MLDVSRRRILKLAPAALAISGATATPVDRNVLTSRYSSDKVSAALIPQNNWKPFPPASDRATWQSLPDDARRVFITRGNEASQTPWTVLTATQALEFRRNGNRTRYEAAQFSRRYKLRDMVLAECIAGDGRLLDEIANGIWLTCEETFWGLPAHLGAQKAGTGLPDPAEPIIDLFAAETAGLLAWIDYLLGDRLDAVSKLLRPRIYAEADRRILTPGLARDFGWMGLGKRAPDAEPPNNWDPWICSNWLTTSLLLDSDNGRRVAAVSKILQCLDAFLNGYGDDGGCNEGPTYWGRAGGSLFDCLEILHSATKGTIDIYREPLIRNMGAYIYRAHVAGDYYLNFGDAAARAKLPGPLIYAYGNRTGDRDLQAFGAWLSHSEENGLARPESLGRALPALFQLRQLREQRPSEVLQRDVWLPDLQVMAARSQAGSAKGLYVGAKGGKNARSHGHNDAGNFVLFADGMPVLVDAGVGTYTAQTFSSHRYDIWTMQSGFHNLPAINGVMQSQARGAQATAIEYSKKGADSILRMNLAGAYPPEANIESWMRTLHFEPAANRLTLHEQFALSLTAPELTLSLMTPCLVNVKNPGELIFVQESKTIVRAAIPKQMTAKVETIDINDERLNGVWGKRLFRILLNWDHPPARGDWQLVFEQSLG